MTRLKPGNENGLKPVASSSPGPSSGGPHSGPPELGDEDEPVVEIPPRSQKWSKMIKWVVFEQKHV